jgi:protein-tyrosine phosphatase
VAGGGETRWGAVVRADSADELTAAGWAAVEQHGVRTVIDLRNDDERDGPAERRPPGITTVHLPHDAIEDRQFWDEWAGGAQGATPLYYAAHLDHFPERSARVLAAVADAPPGGVLVHCAAGRDRTGLITVLLLALAEVETSAIVADYALSDERLIPFWEAREDGDMAAELARFLSGRGTSAAELIAALVEEGDLEARLRSGGLTDDRVAALRERLIEPPAYSDRGDRLR